MKSRKKKSQIDICVLQRRRPFRSAAAYQDSRTRSELRVARGGSAEGPKMHSQLVFRSGCDLLCNWSAAADFSRDWKIRENIFLERWCTSKIRTKSFALFIVRRCGAIRAASHKRQKNVLGDTRSYQYCQIISTMACHWGNSDEGLRACMCEGAKKTARATSMERSRFMFTSWGPAIRVSQEPLVDAERRCVCEHTGNPRAKIINNTTLLFFFRCRCLLQANAHSGASKKADK